MTTTETTTIVKSVRYNRDTRDYAGFLAIDGQTLVDQDFPTAYEAQSAVDAAAYSYLSSLEPAPAEEPAICFHCDRPLAEGESEACARCYQDPTVPPTPAPIITRESISAAVSRARVLCQDAPGWVEAVNKAELELARGCYTWDGATLVIESRTHSGRLYTVTAEGCSCGHKCKWHLAARRILVTAGALPVPPAQPARRAFVAPMPSARALSA